MKVTFLGTSHGVPEANRKCTSVMLTVGKNRYIIDAGVPLMSVLRSMQIDLHDLKAIFITHLHGDHANGLIEFVDLATWHDKDIRPEIWVPEIKAREGIRGWLNVVHGHDVEAEMPGFSEVRPGAFFDDGTLRVTAVRNRHLPDRPSYSYVVECEGKRLVFTGDMGADDYSDFPRSAMDSPCDFVVTEAAHCHLTQCVDIFEKLNTKRLIVSHIVPWNEPEADKLGEMMPYPVCVAWDGMEVEV